MFLIKSNVRNNADLAILDDLERKIFLEVWHLAGDYAIETVCYLRLLFLH